MSRSFPEIFQKSTEGVVQRRYVDVNGVNRVLTRVRAGGWFQWHKVQKFSTTTVWLDETGHQITLADGAWEVFGIKYTDTSN